MITGIFKVSIPEKREIPFEVCADGKPFRVYAEFQSLRKGKYPSKSYPPDTTIPVGYSFNP